ncbi:hypothetical protein M422DRAFT_259665 [Sphaerobolus stellatus SS14]|uniref:CCHC-type domain-containing protein n=1 Tax=Sphaerobolus stellatus (strain SS14) TaxID=990650 RepID=A0A0C9VJI7_SPHS4|nr:hypothetical protein M422DRAFT_259665 [Sphaerobolus stellatus SS14]
MAEEKVNTLLHKEAPEEALLEAAQEVHTIHFQLDQNTSLCEADLMPEQQVRFSANTGKNINSPPREYGVNPIHEVHKARPEADAPLPQQIMSALLMIAQLDGAVVNRATEYSGIQQMVRQAMQNASQEAEPEKTFLAKAGVKMGNPPTYSGESNLEKFKSWVCLIDEAQEWFYHQKWFMPILSLNKVAVNYDNIMQGSMTMQQLHQELLKLAKQMIELQMLLKKGFTPEFSSIDELVDEVGGGNVRANPAYGKNPAQPGNTVNRPTQSNPSRNAVKTNNTVVCYNCNQPGHIQPNCPFANEDRRVAGARIEEVILEEDEGQIEESDEGAPHPEEEQDWEDQPEEDDQQYHFNDDEYKMKSIDEEVVHVNAVIKALGYNDCRRLYGIRVWEAETDLRVFAVV